MPVGHALFYFGIKFNFIKTSKRGCYLSWKRGQSTHLDLKVDVKMVGQRRIRQKEPAGDVNLAPSQSDVNKRCTARDEIKHIAKSIYNTKSVRRNEIFHYKTTKVVTLAIPQKAFGV